MTLTRQQYYAALGLFYLAQAKQQECRTFESELHKLLGLEEGSHVSDAVYTPDDTLDAALKREKIEVEPPPAAN